MSYKVVLQQNPSNILPIVLMKRFTLVSSSLTVRFLLVKLILSLTVSYQLFYKRQNYSHIPIIVLIKRFTLVSSSLTVSH